MPLALASREIIEDFICFFDVVAVDLIALFLGPGIDALPLTFPLHLESIALIKHFLSKTVLLLRVHLFLLPCEYTRLHLLLLLLQKLLTPAYGAV